MITFKHNTIAITNTTTGNRAKYVFEIVGKQGKNACVRPFLTSVASCKRYINERIEYSSK